MIDLLMIFLNLVLIKKENYISGTIRHRMEIWSGKIDPQHAPNQRISCTYQSWNVVDSIYTNSHQK